MLSVIIPTHNEDQNPYFLSNLKMLAKISNIEVICADGHSTDNTQSIIKEHSFVKLVTTSQNTRAARLNAGLLASTHPMVLFNHPRSQLSPEAFEFLKSTHNQTIWGAFTHQFDMNHPLLKFTSWYSNHIRLKKSHIAYLDHCIFCHKSLLFSKASQTDNKSQSQNNSTVLPMVDIFEDTELSLILRQKTSPILRPEVATTSAIRFQKNGLYRQALLNQALKAAYHLKLSKKLMNQIYEKGLSLNTKYR